MNITYTDMRELAAPGTGQGVGLPRNGDGGRTTCKCPKCGTTATHQRGLPCTQTKCPKCGSPMVGV